MHVNGNASTVVADSNVSGFSDDDIDVVAVAGKGFINGVVDYLINQMVQTPGAR